MLMSDRWIPNDLPRFVLFLQQLILGGALTGAKPRSHDYSLHSRQNSNGSSRDHGDSLLPEQAPFFVTARHRHGGHGVRSRPPHSGNL